MFLFTTYLKLFYKTINFCSLFAHAFETFQCLSTFLSSIGPSHDDTVPDADAYRDVFA